MSKDRKTIKEKKKEPTVNLNKKQSSYQSDKGSVSKADNAIGKKSKIIMTEQSIETQTKMYLYDLMNTAKEHGFKADDNWELTMVTDTERKKIQKDYYPTIATKIIPEFLLQVFNLTKMQLKQTLNKNEEVANNRSVVNSELSYIVAFNPKRPRT